MGEVRWCEFVTFGDAAEHIWPALVQLVVATAVVGDAVERLVVPEAEAIHRLIK